VAVAAPAPVRVVAVRAGFSQGALPAPQVSRQERVRAVEALPAALLPVEVPASWVLAAQLQVPGVLPSTR